MTEPEHLALPAPMGTDPKIVSADHLDLWAVTDTIALAFFNVAQSQWIVPDDQQRRRTFWPWTAMQVTRALDTGAVHAWITPERRVLGAALWMWAPGYGPSTDLARYDRQLVAATDEHVDRYRRFEEVVDNHAPPVGSCQVHFWMMGVHPDHQGEGIGSALMRGMHNALDRLSYTAYLEAATQRNRALYQRHGYLDVGHPYNLPDDGPTFYPMVRKPQHSSI